MTTLLNLPPLAPIPPLPPALRRYRWTCDDFVRLARSGFFHDQRVMLVDGEFIHMPNPSPEHEAAVTLTLHSLHAAFLPGHFVRVQGGFPTALDTDPMPDLAVFAGSPRDFAHAHPRAALLIVEVSDSTLAYDRGAKANLYAAAGVPEYWVIDVNDPRLLVFRDPVADATAPRGHRYATTLTLTATDTVTPVAAPTAVIRVADLLP